jgi:DNA modification methylase
MEISPQYVAVIIERFFEATGTEPELIDGGTD